MYIFQLVEYWTNLNMDLRIYVLVFLPLYLVLSLVPNFSYLYPMSVLGGISLMIGLGFTFYYFVEDMPPFSGMETYTEWKSISIYCSVFLYALHNFGILMPLENSMKEPQKFTTILVLGMIVSAFIIVVFGLFGYNKFNYAEDSVVKNLPLDDP